jgi:hypothetical protein
MMALPDQGFANLRFNRGKILHKYTQIARIVAAMDHAMTVSAQHRKIGCHIVSNRAPSSSVDIGLRWCASIKPLPILP